MKRAFLLSAVVAVALSAPAFSQTPRVQGAYVGCITREALNEFQRAASARDTRQMDALLGSRCFLVEGREYSVVERGFTVSRIRVYAGGGSVVLFVPSEATRNSRR